MLRMCLLTVFTDTDSSAAISCRDSSVGSSREPRHRERHHQPISFRQGRSALGRLIRHALVTQLTARHPGQQVSHDHCRFWR